MIQREGKDTPAGNAPGGKQAGFVPSYLARHSGAVIEQRAARSSCRHRAGHKIPSPTGDKHASCCCFDACVRDSIFSLIGPRRARYRARMSPKTPSALKVIIARSISEVEAGYNPLKTVRRGVYGNPLVPRLRK